MIAAARKTGGGNLFYRNQFTLFAAPGTVLSSHFDLLDSLVVRLEGAWHGCGA